jgi:hypothetical protein
MSSALPGMVRPTLLVDVCSAVKLNPKLLAIICLSALLAQIALGLIDPDLKIILWAWAGTV